MSRLSSTQHPSGLGTTNGAGHRRQRPPPVTLLRGPVQGKEHTGVREFDAVQQRVDDATVQARSLPLAGANMIQGLAFSSGVALVVPHGLGRAFVSCLLCGQSASGSIAVQRPSAVRRPLTQQNLLDERQITVTPTFTGSADLLVW